MGRAWPVRPNPTRIVWVGAARSPQEVGIGTGFWGTLWRKISGDEQEVIGRPYGVHADCRKRILVVDTLKKGVHLFDREEKLYYFIGAGTFSHPIGVTEDDHNVAYVTDSASGTVFRFNLGDRNPVPFIQGLQRPTGIVYSPSNQLLYVTDTLAAQVVAYNREGKEVFRFGRPGSGRGEFNLPTDLAVDIQGRIYVTDPLNARIEIFTAKGAYLKEFGSAGDTPGYFGKAKGVAVNSEGHIYVCDAQYDRVQVFNYDGKLLLTFGSTGSGMGEFWMPAGIAIDKDDNIYVADTFNNRIQLLGYVWLD
ncbi:6-bladed beta-propeller [Geomonas sp. Red421]|uniref:6-bladed beta-propeller n=2 Tax=Geomonas anaerohicana TaxID=2798583 RepID=A0ABS0YGW7_9BACT|nr:6-bladed beta-propeller [Geomonas anaerohicana]